MPDVEFSSLRSWVHYEQKLEEAVLAYRSIKDRRKTYLGEAFMTTNAFSESKLVDPMLSQIHQYADNDMEVVDACHRKVRFTVLA